MKTSWAKSIDLRWAKLSDPNPHWAKLSDPIPCWAKVT